MSPPRLFALSAGIRRIPTLPALLDDYELICRRSTVHRPDDCILAWGRRPSAMRAERHARRHGLAVRHIEDGFLRSIGLGRDDAPLSVVLDDTGLYLDADHPSRLEALARRPLDVRQSERARNLATAWRQGRVSKYNHARDPGPDMGEDCVLVVDQTAGDASVACGRADARSFQRMLDAALAEHSASTILIKIHPDVVSGRKRGHFDMARLRAMSRVQVLDRDVHPAYLLQRARAVYTVTSQLGFEALIWNKPVRVFGMPFYAGWSLTQDDLPSPDRRIPITQEQLIHAALIDYSRYVDPETGRRCEAETVLSWMALQRRMRERFDASVAAVGFSRWKRRYVREFFSGSEVRFVKAAKAASAAVATWGCRDEAAPAHARAGVIRVEDGFIRSVGLGADLTRPLSWVQDDMGIYYDASTISRLESLLANTQFAPSLLIRAASLSHAICAAGVTKYNLSGSVAWQRPAGRHVILVPGQVETDASLRYGACHIRTNMGLLEAVRRGNPDALILYKPHPDVAAGLRRRGEREDEALQWCDEVLSNVSLEQLFRQIDEIHVLTSLSGFEALLRGCAVVTYGQPFYAGWGLTQDMALDDAVRSRRHRRLSLDELVAGTLILYPTYVSRVTHRYTTVERALQELVEWRGSRERTPPWRHWIARLFREP